MASTIPTGQPDVSQLRDSKLPDLAFPAQAGERFRIFLEPGIHARLWQHAGENLAIEVCGVLVGRWGKDTRGPFVLISEAIRGEGASNKFAEVTFTHETWARINQEMDTRYSHLAIVGWYHTHPDFGVFLSDRDLFIQQHFFSGPGQVAHVIDPVRKAEGIFVWSGGKPTLAPYFWIGERLVLSATGQRTEAGPAPAETARRDWAEGAGTSPTLGWIIQGLACLALILLGYLLAGRVTDIERNHIEQDAIARAALLVGARPGLREAVEACLAEVDQGVQEVSALSGELTEAQQEKLAAARSALLATRQRLARIGSTYCLTRDETDRMLHYAASVLANNAQGLSREQMAALAQRLERILKEGIDKGLFELDTRPADRPPETPPATKRQAGDAAAK
jgi:proteasome lid subunit RPN8/RPN11